MRSGKSLNHLNMCKNHAKIRDFIIIIYILDSYENFKLNIDMINPQKSM
jgi:hypothetical protein